uniref:Uncharacterized protein n=1 Tax=Anguilla anguilla TaxID=7936 RepID=A0A0E9SYE6_ANGAN
MFFFVANFLHLKHFSEKPPLFYCAI